MRYALVLLFYFGLSISNANAAMVYDNGGPDDSNGWSVHGTVLTQDDFILVGNASITSVGFYFQNFNGITGWDQMIDYQFHSDFGGIPDALLLSEPAQNLVAVESTQPWCCGDGKAWLVTFDLMSAFNASGGSLYWLGLTGAGGDATSAFWVTSSNRGNGRSNGANIGNEFAFYLNGDPLSAVPVPAAFWLFGTALIGFIGISRRRKVA